MLNHLLIAVDGSPSSRRAARFGLALAEQLKAKVTLLTVIPPPELLPFGPMSAYVVKTATPEPDALEKVKALLAEVAAERPGANAQTRVELGPVSDTICDTAKSIDADLIIVGARGLGLGRKLLLGSVSDQVVRHAHCPVTVWR